MTSAAPPLPYDPPQLVYTFLGSYVLTAHFTVTLDRRTFTVPAGYRTDLATVPRIFWWLIPPTGAYEIAAVLHDWLCYLLRQCWEHNRAHPGDSAEPPASSRETDSIFRHLMAAAGVGLVLRWVMWTGVRWGALANSARRAGWWRDAPAVLAITALCLAVVLAVGVAGDRLVHAAAGLLA